VSLMIDYLTEGVTDDRLPNRGVSLMIDYLTEGCH
jgi:hypothetical protein